MSLGQRIQDFLGGVGEAIIRTWLRIFGKKVRRVDAAWLAYPSGPKGRIGEQLYEYIAQKEGLEVRRGVPRAGLLPDFSALAGANFDPDKVHPAVRDFYEHTSQYQLEAWSQTSPITRFFLWILTTFVSRRMDQLNFPLSSMDTARGVTSDIIQLVDRKTGEVARTGWLRKAAGSGRVIYAGLYSVATPASSVPCVGVSFALPLGHSTVFLRPQADDDGSLRLFSVGEHFGDPGFYRVLDEGGDTIKVRFLRSLRERFHVYVDPAGALRTDHTIHFLGLSCLRLHYKIVPLALSSGEPSAISQPGPPDPPA